MQVLSRPAAPSLAASRGRAIGVPFLVPVTARPCVLRKFKERDEDGPLQAPKETLKGDANFVKSDLQQGIKPTGYNAQVKVNPAVPAFTRRRELFMGRLAIIGIVAAGFWETYLPSHPNILQQVSLGLNKLGLTVGPGVALTAILGIVVYSGLVALVPGNPTYSQENQQDVQKRPGGPTNEGANPTGVKEIFGISDWGFTKKNELFNGRMAALGCTAAITNQLLLGGLDGPGPLAQVAAYLRIPTTDAFWSSVPTYFIGFTIFATALSYLKGNTGEKIRFGEKEIYYGTELQHSHCENRRELRATILAMS